MGIKGKSRKLSCSLDPYIGHPKSVWLASTWSSTAFELLAGGISNKICEQFWQMSVMMRFKMSLKRPSAFSWASSCSMYGIRRHHFARNWPEQPGGGKQPSAENKNYTHYIAEGLLLYIDEINELEGLSNLPLVQWLYTLTLTLLRKEMCSSLTRSYPIYLLHARVTHASQYNDFTKFDQNLNPVYLFMICTTEKSSENLQNIQANTSLKR